MSEILERVAKALYALDPIEDTSDGQLFVVPWEAAAVWDKGWVDHCLEQARAAIEAMREPTEAMVGEAEAFEDQQSEQDIMIGGAGITYIADIYRVMIDAALPKESP